MSEDEESKTKAHSKVLKSAYDIQRLKLEKLMKNPTKPVVIPEPPKEKKQLYVPDFVRNVMGSSAGAGSGEFHVYRHLRRKEYARQKAISEMSEKERLDMEFQDKLLENQRKAEERTAKKRAKRLKQKLKRKEKLQQKKMKKGDENEKTSKTDGSSTDSDTESSDGGDQQNGTINR